VLICPVRHHSPAAALQVARLIQARRPQAVLVEGPADATPLIPLLLDPATVPPVALYAYRGGDAVRAAYYPFCQYSPEYAALRAGQAIGARLAFCDLPAAVTLDWHDDDAPDDDAPLATPAPTGAAPPSLTEPCGGPSPTLTEPPGTAPGPPAADADPEPTDYARFAAALAEAAGFAEFEAFWEAAFEQDAGACPPDDYVALLADFGGKARALGDPTRHAHDALREQHMAATARALVAEGIPPDAIVLVCGAAHAAAIHAAFNAEVTPLPPILGERGGTPPTPPGEVGEGLLGRYPPNPPPGERPWTPGELGTLNPPPGERPWTPGEEKQGGPQSGPRSWTPEAGRAAQPPPGSPQDWGARGADPAELALIPFSFPRLSEQSGYGAGNRAPWYYQQVWERDCDYAAATRHALLAVAAHLRQHGYQASLAQCIDGYSLAAMLAGMRDKRAPGVDELADAAVACFGQGQPAVVAAALQQVLVGDAIGRITARVGRTPLQAEFYATAQRLGLPVLDAPRQVLVHMPVAIEAEQSVFLHRLAVADVPFAHELESGLGGGGRAARGGPLEQLGRVREKWELQWTPATDARLVERTAWGSTLAEVGQRLLGQQLAAAERVDDGTAVLLRMALCDLANSFPAALERCEALAADSASFVALARATYHLDGLLAYGAARRLPAERLGALAARLFARAVLHLPDAAVCGDDAAAEIEPALTGLHELVRRQSPAAGDAAAFWDAVEAVAARADSHPGLRGLALVLLELGGRLDRGALAARLRYWLSAAPEAADNARLVAGLFTLHRGTLVRNRALIGAVTDFLAELSIEQLTPLLPVLRRSLGNLSAAERTYLEETLAAILGLRADAADGAPALTPAQTAWLREADAAVAATLADWRERYGIA
jgi:hypothetical protein